MVGSLCYGIIIIIIYYNIKLNYFLTQGNLYELRSDLKIAGAPKGRLSNSLLDGSLIYAHGMLYLYRYRKTAGIVETDIKETIKSFSRSWTCPVTFDVIPNDEICESVASDGSSCKEIKINKWLNIMTRFRRIWGQQPKTVDGESNIAKTSLRPWVFSSCGKRVIIAFFHISDIGHVFSIFDASISKRKNATCALCRSRGDFKPVTARTVPTLVKSGEMEYVFDPCGHLIDEYGEQLWQITIFE